LLSALMSDQMAGEMTERRPDAAAGVTQVRIGGTALRSRQGGRIGPGA
jgi:hypothetical protein